jgi:SAM-dependent methyltransferase
MENTINNMDKNNGGDGVMGGDMAKTYDRDAKAFAEQSAQLMTWKFIGSRALDENMREFYGKKDIRVLDEGSASGRIVEHLIQNGILPENIDGVEISPEQVEIAKAKNLGANFRVADLRKETLPANTYDVVTRHMVDEHLDNEGLLEVSQNTFNALKPGGTLVVIFTHPDKITASSGVIKEGWFETTFPWKGPNGEVLKGKNYFRPVESYLKVLKEAGFVIDKVEDWKISPEAEAVNKEEYEKYKKYGNVRLAVKAHKP